MNSNEAASSPSRKASWRLMEVRFSLKELLEEVAIEHDSGAFGLQKLQQNEISKLFPKKPRKNNAPGD